MNVRLDHCTIGVSDWSRANDFWRDVMRAELLAMPRGVWAYRFGEQLVTAHGPGSDPEPPQVVAPGTSHLAFAWAGSASDAAEHLAAHGVSIELGPVHRRAVGRGEGDSVYFRDPDGSLLELVCYGHREADDTSTRGSSATFYFDLGSPYAYLALERLDRFDFGAVCLRPVSLGHLFKRWGRLSWGVTSRRGLGVAEVEARAREYGLPPIRWPEPWPGNYLNANRAAVVAERLGRLEPYARTAFRAAFAEGCDLAREEVIVQVAEQSGIDRATVLEGVSDPATKQRYRAYTDAACATGVRGVPTLQLSADLFWGDDQLEIAAAKALDSRLTPDGRESDSPRSVEK